MGVRGAAVLVPALSLLATVAIGAGQPAEYGRGLREFVTEMSRTHRFRSLDLDVLLAHAAYRQDVIDAIRRPYEAQPWFRYRALFVTPQRAGRGAAFMRDNSEALQRARATYGVPPEIVTAILGVETDYGGHLGDYPAIDALATLAFAYPPRAAFFRRQLEDLLLLSQEESLSAGTVRGSYAGALGKPQFMPSSYRAYAVDFDGDGRRDLWGSDPDVIGSVAHYLELHGWRTGEPVAAKARVSAPVPGDLPVTEKDPVKPTIPLSTLTGAGVGPSHSPSAAKKVSLIRLPGSQDEYWLGFDNFYVITRYNHSNLYAMAVFQLSQEIKRLSEEPGRQAIASD